MPVLPACDLIFLTDGTILGKKLENIHLTNKELFL